MAKKKNNEFDDNELKVIADRLSSLSIIGEDGSVGFAIEENLEIYKLLSMLRTMIELPDEISELDRHHLLFRAVKDAAKNNESITPVNLKGEVRKQENLYLRKKLQRFVFVTSISVHRAMAIRMQTIRIGKTHIIFDSTLPNKFITKEFERQQEHAKSNLIALPPDDYLPVRIHVSARTDDEAAKRFLYDFEFFRGVWNYFNDIGRGEDVAHFIAPPRKNLPINSILLGPYHTLHNIDGEIASVRYWRESNYCGAITPYLVPRSIDQFYEYFYDVRGKLNKRPVGYRKKLEEAFIRYGQALDERDINIVFMQLWGLLESLTFTVNVSQKETEKRATFLWKEDHEYYSLIVKILKDYRNRYVHASINTREIQNNLNHLRNVVQRLINFHLENPYKFKSMEVAGEFLGSTIDPGMLNKQIREIDEKKIILDGERKIHEFALEFLNR